MACRLATLGAPLAVATSISMRVGGRGVSEALSRIDSAATSCGTSMALLPGVGGLGAGRAFSQPGTCKGAHSCSLRATPVPMTAALGAVPSSARGWA